MKIRMLALVLCLAPSIWAAQEEPNDPNAAVKKPLEARILDPAGSLETLEFVKGGPVELKKGNLYVIEFWATWCAPCRVSIPHLTKVQKTFKDKKVTVIGISNETREKVEPFVKEKAETMDYVVAIDPERKIGEKYMTAYKQNGIPTAFIVDKELRVVWVGHPMADLDTVLEKVVKGEFDAKAYAEARKRREEMDKKAMAAFRAYFAALEKADGAKEAAEQGAIILENASDQVLNAFAWRILTEVEAGKQDYPLALKAATKANDLTQGKNAAIVDTFALALFKNGKVREAIEAQEAALKLAAGDEAREAEFKSRLEEFKKAQPKP